MDFDEFEKTINLDMIVNDPIKLNRYKQLLVQRYAETCDCTTLVETGTYLGDMVAAIAPTFMNIISIELSHELYVRAKQRFILTPNVEILYGNSKDILPNVIKTIHNPIFWLDAHYSEGITARGDKDTPIAEELEIIKDVAKVILIDDARCFGKGDYPTIEYIESWAKEHGFVFENKKDIMRLVRE